MNAEELLGQAYQILATRDRSGSSPRMAAFLARRALEEIIEQRCADLNASAHYAKTRSKLLILRALDADDVARQAAIAWNRLSNACHLHAYEMQPSATEVEHLCDIVEGLIPQQ
ncbi:hypothetical protein NGTWS0302_02420 [Mycolicibacterium cyprinidarum]|uniref:DUF222 domain-containing protein n=1 Tax=Mycolicibacterium cyprinidarum TaxID=2860311 RepID=A0ABQ4VAP8_9MYCO|nr:hypothetical protein NGTWS0302_02420 [Mycolicibacterium sp. NGTWS0302]GJF14216.1 hypothetical protein NGTWS1702_15740 [Mycolicibacterium sp. NGTWSNA01]